MDIKDFYDFGSRLVSSTMQVDAISLEGGLNPLIYGDYEGISFPIVFKHEYGSKLRDILDTGWASLHLISDSLKELLETNGLTGWKTFPVKVLTKKNEEIPGYQGFSITGRCGAIDYKKGELIKKRLIPGGPLWKSRKGVYIGLDQWDGSDFFIPKESRWIVVSQRAAELLKKSKLTNIELRNLAEIELAQR